MEHQRLANRFRATDENLDALKHKAPRVSQQQPTQETSTRVALGSISTNLNSSRIPLAKAAQRVQVYSDATVNDENAVPGRQFKHETKTTTERQPLVEIPDETNMRYYESAYGSHEIPDGAKYCESGYDSDEILEGEHIEEDFDDSIPKGMMPRNTYQISQELRIVYEKFYKEKLDEEDEDTYDVSMVSEYSPEIFNYMHSLEKKLRPNPRYMESQTELKWNMRAILVDWLVQVHSRFNLLPETLFLTVNYIDRFLSKRKVSLSRFQLVGAVALFIAAKYEEINCPSVQEIAYMVDHAYSVDDILRAERFMIDVLEFEMGWPGPMSFLRRTSKADNYDFETRTLAKYFLEITVMDYRFVASPPSWLAAGAHYLSRLLLDKGEWTEAHVYYSGYTEHQVRNLAQVLLQACRNPEEHHKSIYEKYQERRFRRSSLFVQEWFKVADED